MKKCHKNKDGAGTTAHVWPHTGKVAPVQHGDKTPKTNTESLSSRRGTLLHLIFTFAE